MKNLKIHCKVIIFCLLFLNIFFPLSSKNIDKFSNSKDLSNYFSGIIAINDNQYQTSYNYFKKLNNLEESHYSYSQYYLYSLVTLKKFKEAAKYSSQLEKKNLSNFESNIVSGIYYLKNNELDRAKIYFDKLKSQSRPETVQQLLTTALNSWLSSENINSTISNLESLPDRFENIKKIQKVFMYCYYDSAQTDQEFRKLIINPKIDYSRYHFFRAKYLISKKKEKEAREVLNTSIALYPKNLILNQLQTNLKNNYKYSNQFNCKNINHIIAEIFYIVANGLSSQQNYNASNFYLSLAKYLNPAFLSFETLTAKNLEMLEKYPDALKIYEKIKQAGSDYDWHASNRIASILKKQKKNKESTKHLKNSFLKIKKPKAYEIFDYAEFLKNNELYEDAIKYYTELITILDKKHILYSQVLDGRGTAYERVDQWNKAETDLLNSLSLSSEDAYVINYLAYSWIEKGINIEKSLEMLKKANKLRPNDGYIIDSLGWALFKLKKFKEAKKYMQMAVGLMASDPVINDHFADVLWMNNESLQARYYWNYVLKLEKTDKKLRKEIKQKLLFGLKI